MAKTNVKKLLFFLNIIFFHEVHSQTIVYDTGHDNKIRYIAASYPNGKILLWDLSEQKVVKYIAPYKINSMALSVYKKLIYFTTSSGGVFALDFDAKIKYPPRYFPPGPEKIVFRDIALSIDGEDFFCIGKGPQSVDGAWIRKDMSEISYYYDQTSSEIYGLFNEVDFIKNKLVSAYSNGSIKVWNFNYDDRSISLEHTNNSSKSMISSLHILNFSKQSRCVFTDQSNILYLYDYISGELIDKKRSSTNITCISSLQNNNTSGELLVGHKDGTLSFWEIKNLKSLKHLDKSSSLHSGSITGLVILPKSQGKLVITMGEDNHINVIDYLRNYKVLGGLKEDGQFFEKPGFSFSDYF